MEINTESIVGYKNQLKLVGPGMKFEVNSDVNQGTKKVGATTVEGGPSKIKRDTTASAPVASALVASAFITIAPQKTVVNASDQQKTVVAHENNKIVLIADLVLGGYAFSRVVL